MTAGVVQCILSRAFIFAVAIVAVSVHTVGTVFYRTGMVHKHRVAIFIIGK